MAKQQNEIRSKATFNIYGDNYDHTDMSLLSFDVTGDEIVASVVDKHFRGPKKDVLAQLQAACLILETACDCRLDSRDTTATEL